MSNLNTIRFNILKMLDIINKYKLFEIHLKKIDYIIDEKRININSSFYYYNMAILLYSCYLSFSGNFITAFIMFLMVLNFNKINDEKYNKKYILNDPLLKGSTAKDIFKTTLQLCLCEDSMPDEIKERIKITLNKINDETLDLIKYHDFLLELDNSIK